MWCTDISSRQSLSATHVPASVQESDGANTSNEVPDRAANETIGLKSISVSCAVEEFARSIIPTAYPDCLIFSCSVFWEVLRRKGGDSKSIHLAKRERGGIFLYIFFDRLCQVLTLVSDYFVFFQQRIVFSVQFLIFLLGSNQQS